MVRDQVLPVEEVLLRTVPFGFSTEIDVPWMRMRLATGGSAEPAKDFSRIGSARKSVSLLEASSLDWWRCGPTCHSAVSESCSTRHVLPLATRYSMPCLR